MAQIVSLCKMGTMLKNVSKLPVTARRLSKTYIVNLPVVQIIVHCMSIVILHCLSFQLLYYVTDLINQKFLKSHFYFFSFLFLRYIFCENGSFLSSSLPETSISGAPTQCQKQSPYKKTVFFLFPA